MFPAKDCRLPSLGEQLDVGQVACAQVEHVLTPGVFPLGWYGYEFGDECFHACPGLFAEPLQHSDAQQRPRCSSIACWMGLNCLVTVFIPPNGAIFSFLFVLLSCRQSFCLVFAALS